MQGIYILDLPSLMALPEMQPISDGQGGTMQSELQRLIAGISTPIIYENNDPTTAKTAFSFVRGLEGPIPYLLDNYPNIGVTYTLEQICGYYDTKTIDPISGKITWSNLVAPDTAANNAYLSLYTPEETKNILDKNGNIIGSYKTAYWFGIISGAKGKYPHLVHPI